MSIGPSETFGTKLTTVTTTPQRQRLRRYRSRSDDGPESGQSGRRRGNPSRDAGGSGVRRGGSRIARRAAVEVSHKVWIARRSAFTRREIGMPVLAGRYLAAVKRSIRGSAFATAAHVLHELLRTLQSHCDTSTAAARTAGVCLRTVPSDRPSRATFLSLYVTHGGLPRVISYNYMHPPHLCGRGCPAGEARVVMRCCNVLDWL